MPNDLLPSKWHFSALTVVFSDSDNPHSSFMRNSEPVIAAFESCLMRIPNMFSDMMQSMMDPYALSKRLMPYLLRLRLHFSTFSTAVPEHSIPDSPFWLASREVTLIFALSVTNNPEVPFPSEEHLTHSASVFFVIAIPFFWFLITAQFSIVSLLFSICIPLLLPSAVQLLMMIADESRTPMPVCLFLLDVHAVISAFTAFEKRKPWFSDSTAMHPDIATPLVFCFAKKPIPQLFVLHPEMAALTLPSLVKPWKHLSAVESFISHEELP